MQHPDIGLLSARRKSRPTRSELHQVPDVRANPIVSHRWSDVGVLADHSAVCSHLAARDECWVQSHAGAERLCGVLTNRVVYRDEDVSDCDDPVGRVDGDEGGEWMEADVEGFFDDGVRRWQCFPMV